VAVGPARQDFSVGPVGEDFDTAALQEGGVAGVV
jgi:hypothetical protein